eukprot:5842101-Pyramimonas_sp.AAC.1
MPICFVSARLVPVHLISVRSVSSVHRRYVSPRSGAESDFELELAERPARFDCNQFWANHAVGGPGLAA